jgi:transcription initiation factor TFIID subunit TAF12
MDDLRLTQLEASIKEIKESQAKIEQALLGGLDKNSIGLIEESRSQRREIEILKTRSEIQASQIQEQEEFRKDAKKIVTGIAIVIPFVFELVKLGCMGVWEVIKAHK